MHQRPSTRGFTLIEMSIIVIIIGIIVGGIVLARDLVRASEIRSVLSDVEQIQSAVNGFRQKYEYLPGDFPRAESYWTSEATCPVTPTNTTPKTATCNGNGDGRLDTPGWDACPSAPTAASYEQEPFRLWQHLANAEFYKGMYTGVHITGSSRLGRVGVNIPKSLKIKEVGYQIMNFDGVDPAGGAASAHWFDDRYYNVLFIGRGDTVTNCYEPTLPFLSSVETYSLDIKNDDGMPGSGKIRTLTSATTFPALAQPYCASGAAAYSMNKNPRSCSLIWLQEW